MTTDRRAAELEREIAVLQAELASLRSTDSNAELDAIRRLLGDRVVLESIPDVIAVMTREYRILYLNRAVPGVRAADRVGTSVLDYFPADFKPRFQEVFERAWVTGEPQYLELNSISGLSWETRFLPVKDETRVAFMLTTSSDISERKRAERALKKSESRLRHAIAASGMGTWTWDARSDEVWWDETLCRIYGVKVDAYPRTYAEYLRFVHPDDRARVASAVEQRHAAGDLADVEHRIIRGDEVRHLLVKATTQRDEHGNLTGFYGGVFDVTERRKLEEHLRQVQKMDAIGQLTAGIAHNFNNLLSIIIPNTALCLLDSEPQNSERLVDIEHAAHRAAELVRQLMLFARPEANVGKTPTDIVATARQTVEICRTTFDRRIAVELCTAANVPSALAHAGQIEQVLLNVCLNARDALEQVQRPDPRIVIYIDQGPSGMVRIRVADNGPGMTEATRSRVFEPFFTTKPVGRGTGLGLASAYAIIAEHRGRIDCHSRVGQGTTFEIELPVAALPRAEAERRESVLAGGGTETVLIVDDEALVRRAVRGILERAGYRVLDASGGAEGLAALAREPNVDVLILDRSMPGMSGDEVLTNLAALGNRVPVILLSGMPGPPLSLDRRSVVLVKPPNPASLLGALRQLLDAAKK